MKISVPSLSLVVLIGPSGAGKSTFARKHFRATEILSSDACRALVSDEENNQAATRDAFETLRFIAEKRLALGKLTVIDATNVEAPSRQLLVELARKHYCLPVAIVFDMPENLCVARNRERPNRRFGPHVIAQQRSQMRRSLAGLKQEGFRHVDVIQSPEEADSAIVERLPLPCDRRHERGPFDLIGDIHGCGDELETLLGRLGYESVPLPESNPVWGDRCYVHPQGRKAVFLGDLVDRGPRILDSVRIARNMVHAGSGLLVPGNHDTKLMRKLHGRDVSTTHGLQKSLAEIEALPSGLRDLFCRELAALFDSLPSHYVLDGGKLVVAHAGLKQEMHGRAARGVREFALYGETTGEVDELGLPIRLNWAASYRGRAIVVYGHTPVAQPHWQNRTINIDTGCVFGGGLTALRYPEKELVSVDASRTYWEPKRPFAYRRMKDEG